MLLQVATWWRSSTPAKPSWEARSTLRSMILTRSALKAAALEVLDNPLTLKVSRTVRRAGKKVMKKFLEQQTLKGKVMYKIRKQKTT